MVYCRLMPGSKEDWNSEEEARQYERGLGFTELSIELTYQHCLNCVSLKHSKNQL